MMWRLAMVPIYLFIALAMLGFPVIGGIWYVCLIEDIFKIDLSFKYKKIGYLVFFAHSLICFSLFAFGVKKDAKEFGCRLTSYGQIVCI